MAKDFRTNLAQPEAMREHVTRNAIQMREHAMHDHGAKSNEREVIYKGHRIVIRTTYEIEVDGRAITGHISVNNAGQVHYHAVPNSNYPSAVTLVEQLIDIFPDDFPAVVTQQGEPEVTSGHTHAKTVMATRGKPRKGRSP